MAYGHYWKATHLVFQYERLLTFYANMNQQNSNQYDKVLINSFVKRGLIVFHIQNLHQNEDDINF